MFYAGSSQKQIDAKWGAFEAAFGGFAPRYRASLSEEGYDALLNNRGIVCNGAKIDAVRVNTRLLLDLAAKHGSAAARFAEWPDARYVELIAFLQKNGGHLGGLTGMRFLRALGKPAFVLTQDVVAALIRESVISSAPTTKRQMDAIQAAMNERSAQSHRDLTELSRFLAWSVG